MRPSHLFMPCATLCDTSGARCLLTAPNECLSTLLLQCAYNNARAGCSTLYICCGGQDRLARVVPLEPHADGSLAAPAAPAGSTAEHTSLLRRIHIKYVQHAGELRQLLCSMHLAEAPPDALVVDSPQLLRNEPSEATSPARAPLQRRERSTHASPASHRPAHRHELMHAACAIALAAHAADGLTRSRGDVSSVRGGEAPPPPPCVLCVGFSERILEPEIPRRWLRYELTVQNSLGARSHEYSISCTQWPCGTASLPTSFIADRRVLLLDEGKNSQHVEGYPTFNLSALHTPESQSRQFCANGTHTGTPSLVEVRLLPAV